MLASVISLQFAPVAQALDAIWNPTTTDWGTAGNWTNGLPSATQPAEFSSTFSLQPVIASGDTVTAEGLWLTSGLGQDVTINGVTTAGILNITGDATLNGNLTAGILLDDSANHNLTIGDLVTTTLTNATDFYVNNSGTLTFNGTGTINLNAKALTLAGTNASGNINISQATTATAGSIIVNTSGTVTLSGNNLHTGGTTLTAGTLIATGSAGALGNGALSLGGGILDLTNASGTNLAFNRNTTVTGNTQITSDVTSTGGGNTYTLGTLSIGAQTLTIAKGANVNDANAAVTFGATTISGTSSAAVFSPGANSTLTLGTVTGTTPTITMSGAGNLVLNGTISTATALTINSGGTVTMNTNNATTQAALTVNGTLNFNNGQIFGVLNGSGTINENTNALYTNSATSGTFSGTINGTGGYNKQGTGTETLSGANTYSGATNISTATGVLKLANVNAIQNSSSVSVASGTTLQFSVGGTYVTAGTISIAGTGGSVAANSGALWFGQGGSFGSVVNAPINLTAAAKIASYGNTMNQTLGGVISGGVAAGSTALTISSQGGGTDVHSWTIGSTGNASTYTGNTTFTDGGGLTSNTLKLGVTNALPVATILTLSPSATASITKFDLNGQSQQLAGLLNTGTATSAIVLNSGAGTPTLTINNSGSNAFSGMLGTGGTSFALTKAGAGSQTLGGANTYTGDTSVTAGTLAIASTGSLDNTAITVSNAGSTFVVKPGSGTVNLGTTGAGSAGASLTLNSGGTVFSMVDGTAGGTTNLQQQTSFATAGLTLNTATLNFELSGANADKLAVNGTASLTGANTINLTPLAALTAGTYNLITAASGLDTGGTFQFANGLTTGVVTGVNGANTVTLNNAAGVESVTVGASAAAMTWTGQTAGNGATDASWNTTGSTNFAVGTTPVAFSTGNAVTFQDTNTVTTGQVAALSLAVVIQAGGVSPGGTIFNNSAVDYTVSNLSGTIGIAGSGGLSKQGSGSVTLNSANTFTGGVTISAGNLILGNAVALGAAGSENAVAFGAATTGTLTLNGNNVIIANLTGSAVGPVVQNNLAGTATLTVGNASNLGGTYAGLLQDGAAGTLALTKAGTGTLVLSGANTYTGITTVNAGTLSVATLANGGSPSGIGAASNSAANLVLSGGTLSYTGSSVTIDRGFTSTAGTINVATAGQTLTTSGAFVENAATAQGFSVTGSGTLSLTGTIAFSNASGNSLAILGNLTTSGTVTNPSGNIVFQGGTLNVTGGTFTATKITALGNSAAAGSTLTVSGGTFNQSGGSILFGQNATGNSTINLNGGTFQTAVQFSNMTATGNTFNFNGGTLKLGATLTASNGLFGTPANVAVNVQNGGAVIDVNSFSTTISNALLAGTGTGGLTLKSTAGGGTLNLTGASTFTGTTTINAGTLNIGNGGATGSLYSPTVTTGNLTFGSATAITDNSALVYSFNGGATNVNKTISGTGTVSVTSALNATTLLGGVNFAAGTAITTAGSQTYTASSTTGRYNGFNIADNGTVNLISTGGNISMTGLLGTANASTGILKIDTSAGNGSVTLNAAVGVSGVDFGLSALTVTAGTGTITLGNFNSVIPWGVTTTSLTGGAVNSAAAMSGFGTLTVNNSAASTFSGVMSSTGALVKQGAGTLTLTSSTNSYTGATTVNAGTLALGVVTTTGAKLGVTAVTVNSGGTFAAIPGVVTSTANSSIGSTLTLNAGSAFTMADTVANTFTVAGAATLAPASGTAPVLTFDIVGATPDLLAITGIATVGAGGAKIAIAPSTTAITAGSRTIITGTGASNLNANLTLASTLLPNSGGLYTLSLGTSTINATIVTVAADANATYWAGSSSSDWNTAGNWRSSIAGGGAGVVPVSTTDVVFSTTTPVPANLTTNSLSAPLTVNSVYFLPGAASVTVASSVNALTINGGGITNASANPMTINNPITLGTAQTWTNSGAGLLTIGGAITNAANTLTVAGTGNTTIGGILGSGSGGLTKAGAGTLTLTAANTYTGTTSVSAGTLSLTTGSLTGSSVTTSFGGIVSEGAAGVIAGSGATFTQGSSGNSTLAGANTYTGNTVVTAGTLTINGSYAVPGTGTTSLLQIGSGSGTNGNVIVGAAAGTLTFGGDGFANAAQVGTNGGTGTLTINGGTVNIAGTTGAGTAASLSIGGQTSAGAGTGTVTVNGGTLNVGSRILMGFNLTPSSGTLTLNGGAVNVGYTGNLAFSNNQGGILRMGAFTTAVNLNGGTLSLYAFQSDSSTAANTVINFNGGTLKALGSPNFFLSNGGNTAAAPSPRKFRPAARSLIPTPSTSPSPLPWCSTLLSPAAA